MLVKSGAPAIGEEERLSSATEEETTPPRKGTHGEILKSSAMVGGAQLLNVVIGMVRTKAVALLLGPAGFGLFGLYSSVSALSQTVAGLGINSSGVRQIAAAVSRHDGEQIRETAGVLKHVSVALGSLGAFVMIVFARQIAWLTFNSYERTSSIRWLSIAVILTLISNGQTALIQGMRRIADLARLQVLGALSGAVFAIPLVYIYRDRGIVPSLICVAATSIGSSWWFSRKILIHGADSNATPQVVRIKQEVLALLKLGLAFMVSSFVTLGVAYTIRICILHSLGLQATGLYQSAWTLGGFYVGIILQAMGADFYPRLTAHAQDNQQCNRLVNEQTLVGLVVAGPGVIGSLTLAPLVIAVFYSAKFAAAVGILRWICLGAFLQVISFPIGYIIIAKAERTRFVACEIAWGVVSLGFAWYLIPRFGLTGAGMAYFASYLFHCLMLWMIVHRLSGFHWSRDNVRAGAITLTLVVLAFAGLAMLPPVLGITVAAAAFGLSVTYSARILSTFLEQSQLPAWLRKAMVHFRLPRPAAGTL